MSIEIVIPEHIFISYSRLDRECCDRLIADLQRAGVNVWVDRVGLTPGTPSWNKAIRDAISRSFAVLLLASSHSEQSDVVQGELSLARSYGSPIYPLWIGGKWEESVPLNMIQAQRIDLRETRYDAGIAVVLEEVRKVVERRAVKHFPIKDDIDEYFVPNIPLDYLSIAISARKAVAMRPSSYQSLQSLLDDLYLGYLGKKYERYTYGKDWILASLHSDVPRLLVPWNWLVENGGPADENGRDDHQPLFQSNSSWQLCPPKTYGMARDTHWRIIDTFPLRAFGVLTNSPVMSEYLLTWASSDRHSRKRDGILDWRLEDSLVGHNVQEGEVDPAAYKFSGGFRNSVSH